MAADGADANHGLPGFRGLTSPRELKQQIFPLEGPERLIIPLNTPSLRDWKKAAGPYHSRAWTYQEYLFAKRRLIFEHGTVHWECDQCRWDEELIATLQPPKGGDSWHKPDLIRAMRLFEKDSMPNVRSWNLLISDFNKKVLTFPHDALSAFSGIQWALSQACPGGLLYGIPEFFFEAALMWMPSGVTKRRLSSQRSQLKSQLPSWSFLGWQGRATFIPDCEFHAHPDRRAEIMIGVSQPVTTWHTMNHPTSTEKRQIRHNWYEYKTRYQNPSVEEHVGESSSFGNGWHIPVFLGYKIRYKNLTIDPPDGWDIFPFGPNAGYNPPSYTMGYLEESDGPIEYGYRHKSEREICPLMDADAGNYEYYRYPVPIQHGIAQQHHLPPQTQFLFCKTSRAFLHGIPKTSRDDSPTISLLDPGGRNVGFATLMPLEHGEIFAEDTKPKDTVVELVAISEGWACWDDGSNGDGATKYWSSEDRKLCYHVMCIGWEENIAYRRGVGCVLKEVWEDLKDEELVDLTLG